MVILDDHDMNVSEEMYVFASEIRQNVDFMRLGGPDKRLIMV